MLGWALATFVKGMKIRLRKIWLSNLAEREVPQHRNCWWSDEFMINYDGYGFVLCMMCPTSCPSPTLSHNMYCHLTTNTQQHHYHYHTITIPHHTREVMLTTLPQSGQNVSLSIAPALKTTVSGWGGGGGGGGLRHILSDRFFLCLGGGGAKLLP